MYLSHNVNEDHERHGLHQGGHELDEPPHDAGEHHAAAAGHCYPLPGVLMSWPPVSCLLPGHDEPWPSLPRHRHHRTSHAAGFSRQLRSPNCSPSQAAVAWARQCPCIHYLMSHTIQTIHPAGQGRTASWLHAWLDQWWFPQRSMKKTSSDTIP